MDWQLIINTLGAIGIGSAVLAFLSKSLLNSLLSKNLEQFKTQLRIQAFERETLIAKLHEKRAEVIAELYKKLSHAHRSLTDLMSPLQLAGDPSKEEKGKKAAELANAYLDCYLENKIYFDEPLCETLAAFNEKIRKAWISYHMYPSQEQGKESWESRTKAWQTVSEDAPKILKEIENSFRQLLGTIAEPRD